MGCCLDICHKLRKTSFYFLQLRPACLDYGVFMPGCRRQITRLERSAADLDGGDAVQDIGVEECTRIRLDLNDAGVDLDHHLYLLEIIRIDTDIYDPAYRDAIVLDLRAFVEPRH